MEKNNNPSDYQKAYLEDLGISFSDNIDDFNNDSSEYIKIDPSIIGMVDAALQAIPNVLLVLDRSHAFSHQQRLSWHSPPQYP